MAKFKVIREHFGKQPYAVGDIREGAEAELAHLVGTCLEKMDEKPLNKAAKAVKNKSD